MRRVAARARAESDATREAKNRVCFTRTTTDGRGGDGTVVVTRDGWMDGWMDTVCLNAYRWMGWRVYESKRGAFVCPTGAEGGLARRATRRSSASSSSSSSRETDGSRGRLRIFGEEHITHTLIELSD